MRECLLLAREWMDEEIKDWLAIWSRVAYKEGSVGSAVVE